MSALFLVLLVPFILIGNVFLWALGYTVNTDDAQVAQEIVENGGSPKDCYDINFFDLMGPTVGSKQHSCIYRVAELTKDPTACKGLLPSDYGFQCIGAATELTACDLTSDHSVRWNDQSGALQIATQEQCDNSNNLSVRGKNCCYVGKVTFNSDTNDCSSIKDDIPARDVCFRQLAQKKNDISLCESIESDNQKTACQVFMRAKK